MACPDEVKGGQAYLSALEAMRIFKIIGETLELYDEQGNFVARLEARHFK